MPRNFTMEEEINPENVFHKKHMYFFQGNKKLPDFMSKCSPGCNTLEPGGTRSEELGQWARSAKAPGAQSRQAEGRGPRQHCAHTTLSEDRD